MNEATSTTSDVEANHGPLAGVRVVELSQGLALEDGFGGQDTLTWSSCRTSSPRPPAA